jgi:hypothetical protein
MNPTFSLAGHRDTWAFLERRIKDAVDCRKTAQEVIIHLISSSCEYFDLN